jgi:DsbC/DsbD-like thiol-disulfide interchange protein
MRTLLTLALAGLAVLPASAAETPWQELTPGVKLRLISADVLKADGTTEVGLELDMPTSFKTYWRVPGESGIPTSIDLSGSTGVEGADAVWPYPTIDTSAGLVDFVYRGSTVLPIKLRLAADQAALRATVTMGICSDICVPAQAVFTLPLDFARPDRGQGLRLAQAAALAPIAWPGPTEPFGPVTYDATTQSIAVDVLDPAIDPSSIIADAGTDGPLFGAPQKSPETNLVLLPLLGPSGGTDPQGATIELTFTTADGPFSVAKRVVAGSTAQGQ